MTREDLYHHLLIINYKEELKNHDPKNFRGGAYTGNTPGRLYIKRAHAMAEDAMKELDNIARGAADNKFHTGPDLSEYIKFENEYVMKELAARRGNGTHKK